MDNLDEKGWISIYRKIQEHWIWDDPVKFQRWIDLLLEVNHTGKKITIGYTVIECERGQSIRSLSNWAKRWKCSKSAVRRFFEMLERERMIVTESVSKTTRITICNYDSYQELRNDEETMKKRLRNDEETMRDPNNNDNNSNNENNINTSRQKKFNFRKGLIDLGFDKELTDEWISIRKLKKLRNSELAFKNFIKEIEKTNKDKNEVLSVITKKQWGGFEAEWLKNGRNMDGSYAHPSATYIQTEKSSTLDRFNNGNK